MNSEEKKAYLLLKAVVYHYHGLDEEESEDLAKTAEAIGGMDELKWANDFIAEDHFNSFDRAREFLNQIIGDYPKEKRIDYLKLVWSSNNLKGYITELEATAMLKLANDWRVSEELIAMIQSDEP